MAVILTLDKVLKQKNISRYEAAKRTGLHYQTLDKYYKNRISHYDSDILNRLCVALECEISDLIEFKY